MPPGDLVYVKKMTVSVEVLAMSWFKTAKSSILTGSISTGPNRRSIVAPPIDESEISKLETTKLEPAKPETMANPEITKPEIAKLAKSVDAAPRESPKAVFDNLAEAWERSPQEQLPREQLPRDRLPPERLPQKIGFTVHASKNGETSETQRTSPTITVAKARTLFKSGWRVHIADAKGRKYGPAEFDEILKFDRH
jgi:hypothetical protein